MNQVPMALRCICLKPGNLFIGHEPIEVMTLLGSCVAVTMFNSRLRMAAICHAMLADPDIASHPLETEEEPYKYVSLVLPFMVDKFRFNGIGPEEIEVKLFGGANVFGINRERQVGRGIGVANIQRAKEILKQFDLKIARAHVGGCIGRKLIFNTVSGVVWLKCLKSKTADNKLMH